ncbi:hypothetical protein BDP27DRAFT_1358344 [Rhodocollybia butyracea]|uniref:Uncharacterized protein n=1 Tax=Rhodocollybia butyracea TaxID=206335 RepID=A0A9P5Q8K7_9AGAR|nr:hypothetical protein BDP27DRAFT_1358344 [Rhodocollybia butyracea]
MTATPAIVAPAITPAENDPVTVAGTMIPVETVVGIVTVVLRVAAGVVTVTVVGLATGVVVGFATLRIFGVVGKRSIHPEAEAAIVRDANCHLLCQEGIMAEWIYHHRGDLLQIQRASTVVFFPSSWYYVINTNTSSSYKYKKRAVKSSPQLNECQAYTLSKVSVVHVAYIRRSLPSLYRQTSYVLYNCEDWIGYAKHFSITTLLGYIFENNMGTVFDRYFKIISLKTLALLFTMLS